MKWTDEQFEELLDEALSATSDATPSSESTARLTQQIALLTDDALASSLDDALGIGDECEGGTHVGGTYVGGAHVEGGYVGGVPADLVDRIMRATSERDGRSASRPRPDDVLARIGPTARWLLAASLMLAVSWLWLVVLPETTPPELAVVTITPGVSMDKNSQADSDLAVMADGHVDVASNVVADDAIELELELITVALDNLASGGSSDDGYDAIDLEWQLLLDVSLDGPTF